MNKPKVLFLCTANSCRSQMAEGFLRHFAGDRFEAVSAGAAPTQLNPDAGQGHEGARHRHFHSFVKGRHRILEAASHPAEDGQTPPPRPKTHGHALRFGWPRSHDAE